MSTSDDDEALRLNTLHRFRKHSPRLLLQEYSHCEVPAGCGGVVLRWIDREGGLPAVVRVAVLGKVRCWIDAREIRSSRTELSPGPHALAFEITELPRPDTPVLVHVHVNLPRDDATLVRSGPEERWWTIDSAPAGAWTEAGYDAQRCGWSRAVGHSNYDAELSENERWRWSNLARTARALVLPGTRAWLRHEFELSAEAIAQRLADAEERGRA